MSETNVWSSAPRDGTAFSCRFPDGSEARARWNAQSEQWEVVFGEKWVAINYAHGAREPDVWWE